jgi:hypothetical protein
VALTVLYLVVVLSSVSLMSSPPSTNRHSTASPGPRESYNPYLPYAARSVKEEEFADRPDSLGSVPPNLITSARPKKSRFEAFSNVYNAISWILGFKEKYSLALCAWMVSAAFIAAYPSCSDFFWGCSYRILPWAYSNDEPGKCT